MSKKGESTVFSSHAFTLCLLIDTIEPPENHRNHRYDCQELADGELESNRLNRTRHLI